MLHAFLISLAQLGDRRVVLVLLKSLVVTALVFGGLAAAVWWGAHRALGADGQGDVALSSLLAVAVLLLAGWLLFRAVAIAVMGLFADEVVAAVERRHYPEELAGARHVPVARALAMGLGSVGRLVLVNLVLTPVYIVLLVTGVGTFLAFLLVNGWLLGRDLGDMVAARHMPAAALRGWRATTRGRRLVLGLAVAGLFVVPGLNLVAPVLGAAMATHLFHRSWRA